MLLKELISEYDQFDTVAKRATIETLASKHVLRQGIARGVANRKDLPKRRFRITPHEVYKICWVVPSIKSTGRLWKWGSSPRSTKIRSNRYPMVLRMPVGLRWVFYQGSSSTPPASEAQAGEKVIFVFPNDDSSGMMHNLAIITPGSRQTVLDAAVAMGAEGLKKNFIPEIPELLASTPQVAQGMKYTLYFAVPDEPGDYHFICTYPGHGLIMQGIFAVQ